MALGEEPPCSQVRQPGFSLWRISGIKRTRTKVRKPQTSGAVERLHQTIQKGFYQAAFGKKQYRNPVETQTGLDSFMGYCNNQPNNQGRYCL